MIIFLTLILRLRNESSWRKSAQAFFYFSFFVEISLFHWIVVTSGELLNLPGILQLGVMLAFVLLFSIISYLSGILWWYWNKLVRQLTSGKILIEYCLILLFLVVWDRFEPRPPQFSYSAFIVTLSPQLLPAVYQVTALGCAALVYGVIFPIALILTEYRRLNRLIGATLILSIGSCSGAILAVAKYSRNSLRAEFSSSLRIALVQDNQTVTLAQARAPTFLSSFKAQGIAAIHDKLIESIAAKSQSNSAAVMVFWPETLTDLSIDGSGVSQRLCEWAKKTSAMVVAGANEYPEGRETVGAPRYNVVASCSADGSTDLYRKIVLVPFGEYMPLADEIPVLDRYLPKERKLERGSEIDPLTFKEPNSPILLPAICYEVMFDSHIGQFLAKIRKLHPNREVILTTIASDSAFGRFIAPVLYSLLVRWQAARFGLPTVKTSDTGYSQVIAPWGEILASSEINREELVYADLPMHKGDF